MATVVGTGSAPRWDIAIFQEAGRGNCENEYSYVADEIKTVSHGCIDFICVIDDFLGVHKFRVDTVTRMTISPHYEEPPEPVL